jgi:predicted transcriptional regulator
MQIVIRVDDDLGAAFGLLAERRERTISQELRVAMRSWLKAALEDEQRRAATAPGHNARRPPKGATGA